MSQTIDSRPAGAGRPAAPYSRALQLAAGVCLVLAAVTNGLSQYVGELVAGGGDFTEQIRWGAEHVAFHRTEQIAAGGQRAVHATRAARGRAR